MEEDEKFCIKFLENPKINPKTGKRLIVGKGPYNTYVILCQKYGYSIPKPIISSTNQNPIITLLDLSLDLSYLIFPLEILSIIISFTNGNNIIQILCLVDIWFSKNTKLIRFKSIYPNKYPDLRDDGIMSLTNLISLNLDSNKVITDNGIKNLNNLTSLYLYNNNVITDNGIKNLNNLTYLSLEYNKVITHNGIKNLIYLTSLNLKFNVTITDNEIKNLTNLTSLNLSFNEVITNDGVKNLTNLTSLILSYNEVITNDGVKKLGQSYFS